MFLEHRSNRVSKRVLRSIPAQNVLVMHGIQRCLRLFARRAVHAQPLFYTGRPGTARNRDLKTGRTLRETVRRGRVATTLAFGVGGFVGRFCFFLFLCRRRRFLLLLLLLLLLFLRVVVVVVVVVVFRRRRGCRRVKREDVVVFGRRPFNAFVVVSLETEDHSSVMSTTFFFGGTFVLPLFFAVVVVVVVVFSTTMTTTSGCLLEREREREREREKTVVTKVVAPFYFSLRETTRHNKSAITIFFCERETKKKRRRKEGIYKFKLKKREDKTISRKKKKSIKALFRVSNDTSKP